MDARDVLARPRSPRVDFHIEDPWKSRAAMTHRHRQPQGTALRLDAVAIAPAVLVVLDVIVVHEDVRSVELVEESEPRQVTGLQDNRGGHVPAGAAGRSASGRDCIQNTAPNRLLTSR